jgi:MFS family permease
VPQPTAPAPPAARAVYPAYVVGLFSMGMMDVFVILVPLYAISLGLSATQIGILIGVRSVLTMMFAIHAGTLMDRFGTRRVMLFIAGITVVLAPIYPLVPWFPALVLLQILCGGTASLTWLGAQTLIAHIGHGEALYIGRFTFSARIGTSAAPIVAGAIWDLGGAWVAFLFAMAWAGVLFVTILIVSEPNLLAKPEPPSAAPDAAPDASPDASPDAAPETPFRLRDALPRLTDYVQSFAMLAIPAVALTVAVVFVRNSTSGIQNSIYIVYMDEIGLTGTLIGILFAAVEITSGLGALLSGRLMRMADPKWIIVIGATLAIALIAATPLFAGVFALLMLAQLVRGVLQGVIQPIMFSMQAKSVRRDQQGAVVGLRQTMNRTAAIIVPPLMGIIADMTSVADSFLILGAIMLAACGLLALGAHRVPKFEG